MTRYMHLTALALTIGLVGCGNNNNAPPAPAQAPAPVTPPDTTTAGPNRKDRVFLSENVRGSGLPAACLGTVTIEPLPVMWKHRVQWRVLDNEDLPCPDINAAGVELRFDEAIFRDGNSTTNTLTSNAGGIINGVLVDRMAGGVDRQVKFTIWYDADGSGPGLIQQASPDPKIDIEGECGECTN